jgi:uncharacterized lipoprotein
VAAARNGLGSRPRGRDAGTPAREAGRALEEGLARGARQVRGVRHRFIDPDASTPGSGQGILDKLAFWRPAEKAAQPQFRVLVTESGAGSSQVVVQNAKGEAETSNTGRRILALLFDQLK